MVSDYRKNGEPFWERFKAGKKDQLWYLGSLLQIYKRGCNRTGTSGFLLEEFRISLKELLDLSGTVPKVV
jgi:hypothetical protein